MFDEDERLKRTSFATALLRRPELGAVAGLVLVTIFFVLYANPAMFTLAGVMNFMAPAAQLGILAIGAALLMIGGEFDLSIGSMVAFAGLVFGAALVVWELPLPLAILVAFGFAILVGSVNAQIVLRTGLPSFIVTLAFLFILRGLTLVGLKWASGGSTQLRGMREAASGSVLAPIFSGDAFGGLFQWLAARGAIAAFPNGQPTVPGVPVEILWFVLFAILATWLLLRTPFGNWIFASGGDPRAARKVGVPVDRVKTILFIITASCATLVAILTVLDAGSTDARRGFQKEFEAIIAAVIGGCLLTGGYGSAIGAFFGSIVFGMVLIGLTYTSIDQDWYLVFLGGMLLLAVVFNNVIRKRVTGER
ncbi:monosaccharide ABC transporter membrane protein, CUT2 family [Aureimonas altamirensis DSM 21988]|jgi:simple sugar transport system permease protein|uniref:Xylose transport system permease protein XylH n=2 Tax=Aureimonas altamirensis TaxID=370622 RepID=A0A0N7KX81_9HYPH|nr:ABC transporter permease [Aureimonas altamirensis]BAT26185.1 sugar ABC transporter permease [Aureimonas altamirensis]SHJ40166.1 monosaccharide ABC transporter membrane protein, CUT2 family [Aureimonas altamirensis DSM 21988]